MTTISDFLEGQFRPDAPSEVGSEGRRTGAPVRARIAATERDDAQSRLRSWLLARSATFRADLAAAWVWFCRPPTLAELWSGVVPDRDRVPARNAALWVAWIGFNVVTLPVFAVAWPALWVLAHPARLVLAAAVAVPLYFVWI